MGNSGQDVKVPTQCGDSRSYYFNISPQINTWVNSINTSLGYMCIMNKNISSTESFIQFTKPLLQIHFQQVI